MDRRYFTRGLGLLGLLVLPWNKVTAQTSEPLTYKAKLTQTNDTAPVADEIVNTLGCNVDWIYHDLGTYIGEIEIDFPEDSKVFCYTPVRDASGDITTGSAVVFTMDGNLGSVMISGYGTPEDGSLQRRDVEGAIFVRFDVYPAETHNPPN